jgi:integrase
MSRTRKDNGASWISDTPDTDGYHNAFVSMGTKPNGKPDRRHVRRKSLAAVRKRVRELERDRDAGRVNKPGKVPTVQEMLERHLTVILPSRNRAPRTIDDYWSKCRNDIFPRWGGQRADRLLPEQVEDGLADMLAEGRAPSHVRKVYAILSSAYQVQVERENLKRNPCEHVEAPGLPEAEKASLTLDEALAVLAAAAGRPNPDRWMVALTHGLRQGEALGMRWKYLNLETGELKIFHQLQRLKWRHGCFDDRGRALAKTGVTREKIAGARREAEHACALGHCKVRPCRKGCTFHTRECPPPCGPDCTEHATDCPERKDGGLVLRDIKEKRRKTVWLDEWFCARLKQHHDDQVIQSKEADREWEDHGLVFCQWNGKPIDPRRDWGEWGEILEASGLPPQRLHAMRHSAASLLILQGVPVPVVQKMLGHSDIRVTQGYVHVAEAQMRDASGRMARAMRPGPTATGTATGHPVE